MSTCSRLLEAFVIGTLVMIALAIPACLFAKNKVEPNMAIVMLWIASVSVVFITNGRTKKL